MRIAVVTTSYPETEDDPAGHFVRAEVDALRAEGHAVEVLAARGRAFGWPGVVTRLRERPWLAASVVRELGRMRGALACSRPERLVAHWAVPCGIVARGLGDLELVSHGADVRLLCGLPRPARTHLVHAFCNDARVWRFVASSLLRELLVTLPAALQARVERIAVVRASPIELPDRARLPVVARRHDRALAVSVGRLVTSKRVDRAIDYVATMPGAELVVIGDGPERERLERHARARGVEARFVGLLPRRECLAWIATADVLLHASEAEGLSTVLREAKAFGTTIVRLDESVDGHATNSGPKSKTAPTRVGAA